MSKGKSTEAVEDSQYLVETVLQLLCDNSVSPKIYSLGQNSVFFILIKQIFEVLKVRAGELT